MRDWDAEEWVVFVLIVLTGLCAVGGACGGCTIGGLGGADGEHAAYVIAVEDQDNASWDSTVAHVKTNPQASNEDRYCVTDAAVRKQLEDAAESGARVMLHYRNDFIMWRWECNGGDSIIWKVTLPAETP